MKTEPSPTPEQTEEQKEFLLLAMAEQRLRQTRQARTGPGTRSCITLHRGIVKDRTRNLRRKLEGRYVWP
jgi:hypothetical protein